MKQGFINRAMAALGPLEDDPQGQTMSRGGAEACVREIAEWYVDAVQEVKTTPRPGEVKAKLLVVAKRAAELREAMEMVTGYAQIAVLIECAAILKSQDPEMLKIYETADGQDLPNESVWNGEPNGSARWLARLNALESLYNRVAEDPRLTDGGGPSLRLISRWVGAPNFQLVCRCMALLTACGKRFGRRSADGPLVKLLSAVAGKDKDMLTSFLNDIAEVVDNPHAENIQKFYAALWISVDLRGRRPEGHPDIQEAEARFDGVKPNVPRCSRNVASLIPIPKNDL